MSIDNLNEDKFDEMLGKSLQRHPEPVPAGFTERMLTQIEEAEQRAILARVIWQKRLALDGCIVFGALAAVGMTVFPGRIAGTLRSIGANLREGGGSFVGRIGQAIPIETVRSEWQLYTILALVLGFAVFSLLDMLLGDKLKIRIV